MKAKYIAAIDFGTSRTGFAWCSFGETTGISDIHVRNDWPGLPNDYVKTYTELFYDSQNDKWYFGGEAHKIRITGEDFQGNKITGKHFKEYKMNLYDTKQADRTDKTMDLIVQTLKELKEFVFKNMEDNFGEVSLFSREEFDTEVQWVLTVPEGATDNDKYYMREAAIRAGLIKKDNEDFERLIFALEPEAGIITCIKNDVAKDLIKNEQTVVVFDAGGGTVDITVRKFCPKNNNTSSKLSSIKNIQGDCEPAGSKYMDKCFFEYLSNFFGERVWNEISTKYKTDFQEIANDWANGKEATTSYSSGENFELSIDVSALWETLEEISPDEHKLLKNTIENNSESIIVKNNYEYQFKGRKYKYIVIDKKKFENIFHQIFENAYAPLKNVLKQLDAQKIKCDSLFFIGGFSCNPCLREFIKKQISNDFAYLKQIRYVEIESNKMSSAVLLGAVLYAADPGFIADRVVKLTYGVHCRINGEDNCFSPLILKGDKINFDKEIQHSFNPIEPNQTVVSFQFYSTERTDVKKSTDISLTPLEKVSVDCPDTTGGCNREILVTLTFGGTETIATVFDKTSGNKKQISLHMPLAWSY